jgi:hypothetical protein
MKISKLQQITIYLISFISIQVHGQVVSLDSLFNHNPCQTTIHLLNETLHTNIVASRPASFTKSDFALSVNNKCKSCSITIRPSKRFSLNGVQTDKIDFDFISNITSGQLGGSSFQVLPYKNNSFRIVFEYTQPDLSRVELTYKTSAKQHKNAILCTSSDFAYYKNSVLEKIKVTAAKSHQNLSEPYIKILRQIDFLDSLAKAGQKNRAITKYKILATKYGSDLTEYINIHGRLSELYRQSHKYRKEQNENTLLITDSPDHEKGLYQTRNCELYLYRGRYNDLRRAYNVCIGSQYTTPEQKFLATLYYFTALVITNKNATEKLADLNEASQHCGFSQPCSALGQLADWITKKEIQFEKRERILAAINLTSDDQTVVSSAKTEKGNIPENYPSATVVGFDH